MEAGLNLGDIIEVEVTRITDFGAFAKINGGSLGLIHISQISNSFVKDVKEHLKVGDRLKARVIKLGPGKKIDLSLKLQTENTAEVKTNKRNNSSSGAQRFAGRTGFKSSDFEDKLKNFLRNSRQNLADLEKHNENYRR